MTDQVVGGLDGLEEAIKELDVQTSQKALRNALMYSSKPMVEHMKASAPYDESDENGDRKHLLDYIKRRSEKGNGDHAAKVRVGVFSGRMARIAYMLNYGTKYIRAFPWLNNSAAANVDITIERFVSKLRKNLEKAKR